MKKFFIITTSIALLAASCSSQTVDNISQSVQSSPEDSATKIEEELYPISLPAFSQKKFDGRDLQLGQVQSETTNYNRYYITYKSGEFIISGIMNVPKGGGPFPVVIMNHGYIDPTVYTNGRGLRREQDYFANRGYIVVHPDYRNHAQSDKDLNVERNIRLGYVEDVINSIYALKDAKLPYADTSRIAMIGHSMGGGIAQAIMVVEPELVDAFMLYAPVSSDVRESYYRWTISRPDAVAQIKAQHGDPETNPEFWDNMSPVNFFERVNSPILINHGTNDADVPLEWSHRTRDALQAVGKEVILHEYPGEGHEFGPAWGRLMQRTIDFFNSNLN